MKFIIHRGTHEIGGSCVEVFSGEHRLLLDIGMPLVNPDGTQFDGKAAGSLPPKDLIKRKVLPDIKGLYAWDKTGAPVDAILLSHPHVDHYGFLHYVNPAITVCMGESGKRMIDITAIFTPNKNTIANFKPVKSDVSFNIGPFKITPYLMDHAAFDSYAYLVEADGKKLFYSGDFRSHGRKKRAFDWFLYNGPENVDVLLMEGTMLSRNSDKTKSETEIEKEIQAIAEKTQGIVLVYASSQNIDRFISIYKAAYRTGRKLVVDVYTANVLEGIKDAGKIPHPSSQWPILKVCFPPNICDKLKADGKADMFYKFKNYKITKAQIEENDGKLMMLVRPVMKPFFLNIPDIKSGAFIYSQWSGYLKDKKTAAFIETLRKKGMEFYTVHTSGHADIETLKKMAGRLKPRKIVPIHSFEPQNMRSFFNNVILLNDGEAMEIP